MLNIKASPKFFIFIIILITFLILSYLLVNHQKLDRFLGTITPTQILQPYMTTFTPNQSETANGIEMQLWEIDIMSSSMERINNTALYVDILLCFDKPSINEINDWGIGQSTKLEIGQESANISSSSVLFDSKNSYVGKKPLPPWLPKSGNKRCAKASFHFDPSTELIWRLALDVPVTTNLNLIIYKLSESNHQPYTFDGPWIFHVILNP